MDTDERVPVHLTVECHGPDWFSVHIEDEIGTVAVSSARTLDQAAAGAVPHIVHAATTAHVER